MHASIRNPEGNTTGGAMAAYDMVREEVFTFPYDSRFVRKPTVVVFGRGSQAPSIATTDWGAGLVGAAGIGLTAAAVTFILSMKGIGFVDHGAGDAMMHIKGWAAELFHIMPESWLSPLEQWKETARGITKGMVGASAFVSGAVGAFLAPIGFKAFSQPQDGHLHMKGRRLLDNKDALAAWKAACLRECKGANGKFDHLQLDLEIIPGVPTSRKRMKRHGVVLGPPGSGKTVLLAPLKERAIRSGARNLFFDVKGDDTEYFYEETWDKNHPLTDPGKASPNNRIVLMSPFDKRTDVWDIAADIRDKQEAVEFAEANIPTGDGESKMWTQSAQAVVIGCVHMLQCEKPDKWTCGDLAALLGQTNMKIFIEILKRYHPEGLRAVDTADVTQAGVMTNVMAAMAPIFSLADAWPERIEGKMFSVRKWAEASGKELDEMRKTVIIKGNPKYPAIVRACAGAIFQLAQSILTSLPDDPTRDFNIFLDEFPALGKVEIEKLITLGRSKGVGVWLGMQTMNQLKQVHGEDLALSLKNNISTFISLGAVGPDCEEISNLIGERSVERMSVSGTGPNAVVNAQLQNMKTLEASQVALLGEREGVGVKAAIWGKGLEDLLLLDLPYPNKLKHPLRKVGRPEVLADWVKAENSMKMMGQRLKRAEDGAKFLRAWADQYKTDISDKNEKKQGSAPPAAVPNHLDATKPFVQDPADDQKTVDEKRKLWAKAKYSAMKESKGAAEGVVDMSPRRRREEDDDGDRAEESVSAQKDDLAMRIAASNDPAELEGLLEKARGGPAEKLIRSKIRNLRLVQKGATPSAAAGGLDAERRSESMTIDPPIYVPNPASAGRVSKPVEEGDDPLSEAVAEHAETALLGSLLGTDLAELVIHCAEAAEKSAQGGPAAGPRDMIPIYKPPRKT